MGGALYAFCSGAGFDGQGTSGKLWRGQRRSGIAGDALSGGVYAAIGGGEGYQRIPKPQKGLEGTGKKMIAEGVDEADYACYALRRYGIRPKDWAEMTTPERMFCCAVIEMEIAAEEKR